MLGPAFWRLSYEAAPTGVYLSFFGLEIRAGSTLANGTGAATGFFASFLGFRASLPGLIAPFAMSSSLGAFD